MLVGGENSVLVEIRRVIGSEPLHSRTKGTDEESEKAKQCAQGMVSVALESLKPFLVDGPQ